MASLRVTTLFVLLVGLFASQRVASQNPPPTIYSLPSTITPRFYSIRLDPDMDSGVITGNIKIEVKTINTTTQPLKSVVLHFGRNGNATVNELTAVYVDMDGTVQHFGHVGYDDPNTLLTLDLYDNQTLKYNHIYVISLDFTSLLNTEAKGLFVGSYSSSKYIASNFRPTYARDVFPCFDEPQFKVPVALQVWRPVTHYAVSTAPLAYNSSNIVNNKQLDTFENTDPISIHSLGLFIGQQPIKESLNMSVVLPLSLPLPTSVGYLNNLISAITNSHGPLPKLFYLIVLPDKVHTSFSSFGFVFTSPEVYLGEVGSPLQWTSLQLQLTEEFLRQYLEYPKTPRWWSDLWLSESIGTFLSLPLQQSEPWLQDWLNIVIRSEALGSYISVSGPVITHPNLTKWDIEDLVSNQSVKYKGVSTLQMWDATMPEGLVLKTIKDFMSLPQSLVDTSDLTKLMVDNIINSSSSYNVTPAIDLLGNWITEPGSPLVWFYIHDQVNSTFVLDQGKLCSGTSEAAWRSISIAVANGADPGWNDTRQGRWLLNNISVYNYTNISLSSVINIETAPYRVNYPDDQWKVLAEALSSGWAPASVASALQDDAVALSLGGCLNFATTLSVLNSSQHYDLGWYPIVRAMDAFTANIGNDTEGLALFGTYFASLFTTELLDQLDLRKSANQTDLSVARELVTPWLCRFNISSCREAVVELGASLWIGNTTGIAGSDVDNVACYGARYTPGALVPLMNAYHNVLDPLLKRYVTIALSCLTDQDSVNQLLSVIINNSSASAQVNLRSEDSPVTFFSQSDAQQILVGLASSLENSQTVMDVVLSQSNIIDVQEKFGVNTLTSIMKSLAKHKADLSQLSSLVNNTQLNPNVKQSASEAIAVTTFIQNWYSNYSYQLYQDLPGGSNITTTTTTTTTTQGTTTTSPGTTTNSPSPSHSPTSAPGVSSALSYCKLLIFSLSALLITIWT